MGSEAINYTLYNKDVCLVIGEGASAEESLKPVPILFNSKRRIYHLHRRVPRCFNCGDEKHMVSSCPLPRNPSLISLSRAMYEFFQQNNGRRESERIHEYGERISRMKHYNTIFEPGKLGQDVLTALGFQEDEDLTRLPWYFRMLDWGYPPGWVSVENPKDKVNARIQSEEGTMDDVETLQIFRSASPSSEGETMNDSMTESFEQCDEPTPEKNSHIAKRWAIYSTTLFSSERLTIYSGKRLPTDMDDAPTGRIPPWRHPGAFSAFGPVGWQRTVIAYDSEINDEELEMDLSD